MRELIERLAKIMAILGGVVLLLLVVIVCVSIIGRTFNTILHLDWVQNSIGAFANGLINMGVGPVKGDYELVEAGVAFAIFSFLPLCQLYSSHATVEVFSIFYPEKFNRFLTVLWEVIFAAVLILIFWRLFAGTQSKFNNGETTFLLQFPVWWGYAASLVASLVAAIVGIYCAYARIVEEITGNSILPDSEGAIH